MTLCDLCVTSHQRGQTKIGGDGLLMGNGQLFCIIPERWPYFKEGWSLTVALLQGRVKILLYLKGGSK